MPSVSALQLDCGPGAEAEEKTQHTLTCEGLQANDTIYWTKYDRNLGKITVATCDATGSCQTNFSTRYDVKRPNNITSTLKILDVKRDDTFVEGEWSCVIRSNETASCYVTVVFLPHVGECTVGFNEQSGQVTGRCEMHKVYPSPTCNWYERLEGQETDIPSNQTILTLTQYVDSSSSQIYFRGECMLKRPLPVTAGSYSYKVLIIPGLVEPLVDFTTTKRVAVPAPPVLRNCPQDYVTNADASSCTCATSDLGSPQGSIAWYDPNKNVVLRNTSLILALPFSRVTAEFSGQTYRCGVVHHTGSLSVDYVPKIAAPPNKPKLSGFDKNNVYEIGTTLSLQCLADGGLPAITRVILQCADRPDEEDIHEGGRVIGRLSLTLQDSHKSGECVCSATNGFLTSERVTLPISDILTSDSGKGDKLELWHVIVIAVAGALVLVIIAVVVAVKKCKSRKKSVEHTPLTTAADAHDTSSDGEPATLPTLSETEECGVSKNSGPCAVAETNDCSHGVSSGTSGVREKNRKSKARLANIGQLANGTNPKPENVYNTLPRRAPPKENEYSTIDEASQRAARMARSSSFQNKELKSSLDPQHTDRQAREGLNSENTSLMNQNSAGDHENNSTVEDNDSSDRNKEKQRQTDDNQNTLNPANKLSTPQTPTPSGQSGDTSDLAQTNTTKKNVQKTGAQNPTLSSDSSTDNESRDDRFPVDSDTDKPDTQRETPSISTTGPTTAASTVQDVRNLPSLGPQIQQLSPVPQYSSSDKEMENGKKDSKKISKSEKQATDQEREVDKHSNSNPERQQNQPQQDDRAGNKPKVKPETTQSLSGSATPVPIDGQPSVAEPQQTHTTQPVEDKEPASASASASGGETENRTNTKGDSSSTEIAKEETLAVNPLDNADSSSPHKTGGSDGKQRDLRSSADSPDESKDEDKGTEGHKTASDDSSEGERQPIRAETIKTSPIAISDAHDKIDQRNSSSPAGHHAESSADNEPGRRDAPAGLDLVKSSNPRMEMPKTSFTKESSGQCHNANTSPMLPTYKTLIQIATDNKPKEESLASSTNSTVKHPQAEKL